MIALNYLRGHRLALATDDPFTPIYMAQGMPLWGVDLLGPMRTAAELTSHLESEAPATLALISVNLPGLDEAVHQLLLDRKVRFMTFGATMSAGAMKNATCMAWPFTAFQIASEFALSLRK
jgi:hypothetical protein